MSWINVVYNLNHCSCKDTAHLVLNTYYSESSLVLLKRRRLFGCEAAMASSSSSSAGMFSTGFIFEFIVLSFCLIVEVLVIYWHINDL